MIFFYSVKEQLGEVTYVQLPEVDLEVKEGGEI